MSAPGRVDDVGDGKAEARQTLLVDRDAILGQLAPNGDDLGDPGNGKDRLSHLELGPGSEFQRRNGSLG